MSQKTFREAEARFRPASTCDELTPSKLTYDRAVELELAEELTSAFRLYIEASQAFLHLSCSGVATPIQARCRANAEKAFQRAEKIKKASKTGVVVAPIDSFGADHQAYILRKSVTVNGVCYPLWTDPVHLPSDPETRYSDPNGQPPINDPIVTTWKRPLNYSYSRDISLSLTPADIDQNIINDCSVCASVAVCVQHNQRFNSRLLLSSLVPGNQPGRYDIKVYLNGDYRRNSNVSFVPFVHPTIDCPFTPVPSQILYVVGSEAIDDLLPFDDTGRPVGISSGRKSVVWPALIEKAYMKLMGGYDFPGSNSSIDLRVLTGWIPEHVELQSTSFERERTWERIANGFQKGRCLLSVGTDFKTMQKIEGAKLLPSHDYAVVNVRETKGERWITLIDSRVSAISITRVGGENHSSSGGNSRMLDMRWDDICATFEGLYLSWDPGLLRDGTHLHGIWKPVNSDDKEQTSVRHLRLLYECQQLSAGNWDPLDTSKDIWVLLSRHLSYTHRGAEYISLTVRPEDEDNWRDIWVKTGDTGVKGTYTTSPHVLVRTRIGEGLPSSSAALPAAKISGALSILASYDGPFEDVFFTVNVFCGTDVKVRWDQDAGIGDSIGPRGVGFTMKVDGAFITKNAGGNHSHPTYMLNPQWHLRICDEILRSSVLSSSGRASPQRGAIGSSSVASRRDRAGKKSAVVLSARGPRDVPLNVTVVWSSGERIVELAQKDVVASSGAYTYGQARASADIAPGDYTVIVSAFEPEVHLGQFTLKIESARQFDLVPIQQEGAGMYSRVSKGEWSECTAAGGPSHGRYHLNPIYEVQLSSTAKLSARLQLTSPAPTATLNLSLFPASSSAPRTPALDRLLASSGPYSDALAGVCISERTLSPGRYWFVPSTFAAGVHASFRLVVYCSDQGCIVSRWTS